MAIKKVRPSGVSIAASEIRFDFRHPGWMIAGAAVLVATWSITFMSPVSDGDLWFQMAYARLMLENRTLIPDHTAFSWTPTDGSLIYCAWFMEFLLYGLYSLGGLPLLFVFRYLVFGVFLLLLFLHARRLGVERHPLTWFVGLLALMMSPEIQTVKPNQASFVFMCLTVWTWLRIKHGDEQAWRWCYLLPLLMLVWVNSHGGFIVGLGFLGFMAVGELLNIRFSRELALSARVQKHLLIALALTGLAVFVNPYGWSYLIQLLTVAPSKAALSAVREYDTIFAPNQLGRHYVDYAAIGFVLIVGLLLPAARRRRVDWALVLVNLVFAALYVLYVRMTIFWAPIVALTAVSLLGERPGWAFPRMLRVARVLGVAVLLTGGVLGARVVWLGIEAPVLGGWLGFGNSYMNPEEETAYIGEHFRDARICNDYNSGAYLLWKLGPRTKVFMDARQFPYLSWFTAYLAFETTQGIADLLKKYPCDVALVVLPLGRTVSWFKASPDWTPAFYGASAAVFVKRGIPLPGGRVQSGQGIDDVRNRIQALMVLAFAIDIQDIASAERVVAGMQRRFSITGSQRKIVEQSRALLEGVKAYRRRDYVSAVESLTVASGTFSGTPQDMLVRSALQLMDRAWHGNEDRRALELSLFATRYAPKDPIPRYNSGVIKWWLRGDVGGLSSEAGASSWRQDLEAFIQLLPNDTGVHPRAIEIARTILQGKGEGRPPLMVKPEPQLSVGQR